MPDVLTIPQSIERARADGLPVTEYALRAWVKSGAVPVRMIDRLLVLAFGIGGVDWDSPPPPAQEQSEAGEYLRMAAELTGLKYSLVAGLLAGMQRHIRESAELSEDIRGGILEAVKTAQARLVLNAAFDLT